MPPVSLLIKPASGSCNMRCRYCFYVDETRNREVALRGRMTDETMRAMVDKALDYAEGGCTFSFQGGEPTLAGLDYFRKLSDYAEHHPKAKGLQIGYTIQTNGYALDEDWCRWFREHKVLVGISLDGPKEIHDRYRLDAEGKGTFRRVMASIALLKKHQVDFNVLTVVSAANARRGGQVYNFFKKEELTYQQYIECLDPIGHPQGEAEYSLTADKYEVFLKNMFDAWYRDVKAGQYVYNRYFENLLMILTGQQPESCNLRGVCQAQWVIEADGSVYPCDFYALDPWLLGNICRDSFAQMEEARRASGFVAWSVRLPEECRNCAALPLCRNGCRRNREPVSADQTGRNYFCSAYKGFLEYAYPRLRELAQDILRHAGKIK